MSLVVLLCTLPLALLTPPFQVPDEMQHFYRAYEISHPGIKGYVKGPTAGSDLPSSLSDMTRHYLGTKAFLSPPVITRSLSETLSYRSAPLDPDKTEYTVYTNQIIYSPLAYLPQAAGILIAERLGAGPLELLYSARVMNALVAGLLFALAFAKLKAGRLAILAVALMPMTMYEVASASADASVIGCAALYTSLSLRGYWERHWKAHEIVLALISGLIFCTAKFAYIPMLFIALPVWLRRPRDIDALLFQIVVPAVIVLCTFAWLRHVSGMVLISNPNLQQSNVADQIAAMRAHPLVLLSVAGHTIAHGTVYLRGFIGNLGWLSIPLPLYSYALGCVALLAAMFSYARSQAIVRVPASILHLVIAAASCALVALALYLTWTPPGKTMVDGIQGRYATPVAPLVILAVQAILARVSPWPDQAFTRVVCVACVLANVAICYTVISRSFGLFA